MTDMLKRTLRRFGGAALLDHLPSVDWKLVHNAQQAELIDARLRAVEVELDVQARRRLNFNQKG